MVGSANEVASPKSATPAYKYSCLKCKVLFSDRDALSAHYKSNWHKHNMVELSWRLLGGKKPSCEDLSIHSTPPKPRAEKRRKSTCSKETIGGEKPSCEDLSIPSPPPKPSAEMRRKSTCSKVNRNPAGKMANAHF